MQYDSKEDEASAEAQGLDQKTLEDTLAPLGLKAMLFIGATKHGDAFSMLEGTGADFITLLMVLVKEQPELVGMFLNTLVAMASQATNDMMGGLYEPATEAETEAEPAIMGQVKF